MAATDSRLQAFTQRLLRRLRSDPALSRRMSELERRTTGVEFELRRHTEALERLELLGQDLVAANEALRRRIEDDRDRG